MKRGGAGASEKDVGRLLRDIVAWIAAGLKDKYADRAAHDQLSRGVRVKYGVKLRPIRA